MLGLCLWTSHQHPLYEADAQTSPLGSSLCSFQSWATTGIQGFVVSTFFLHFACCLDKHRDSLEALARCWAVNRDLLLMALTLLEELTSLRGLCLPPVGGTPPPAFHLAAWFFVIFPVHYLHFLAGWKECELCRTNLDSIASSSSIPEWPWVHPLNWLNFGSFIHQKW